MSTHVRTRHEDGYTWLLLDRPEKRNALTVDMIQSLTREIHRCAEDDQVVAIIISGTGNTFSAGVDVQQFAVMEVASAPGFIRQLHELCAAARFSPKPVIAAIDGPCLGGAFELALSCDLRIATSNALFGLPEVHLGLPSVIEAALLLHHIGLSKTQEMVLTGDPITAVEAEKLGLITRITSPDRLESEALTEAGRLARIDREAFALQKQLINSWLNEPLERAIQNSFWAFATSLGSETPRQLVTEFLNRKKR